MRFRQLAMIVAALAMVVALAGCNSLVQGNKASGGSKGGGNSASQNSSSQGGSQTSTQSSGGQSTQQAAGPSDPTLAISIPKLGISYNNIPTGRADDQQLLMNNAAVHIYPTGFPWQKGANTYIAGHIAGYRGTPSYQAFKGIDQLQNGDEIILTDANGKQYTYKVFKTETIPPQQTSVLNPIPGKTIVTLQTCKIIRYNPDGSPDYNNTDRTIVQGQLQS